MIFYLGIAELFDHYCNVEYFVVVVEVDGNVKLLVMLLGIRRLACVSYLLVLYYQDNLVENGRQLHLFVRKQKLQ